MKSINKIILIVLILSCGFIVGCSDDDDKTAVESVKILQTVNDTIFLDKGDTHQLSVETTPKNQSVKYYTTNAKVFTISETGIITANAGGVGALHVVAPNGDAWTKATCIIDVTEYVDSIGVNDRNAVILPLDQTSNISSRFTAYPAEAKNRILAYKSSNTSIAIIDANGVITPLAKGIIEITAVPTDGKYDVTSDPIKIYVGYETKPVDRSMWTALASSTQGSKYVSNLFDGNTGTTWEASYSAKLPFWILIDTKQMTQFDQIEFIQSSYREAKTIEVFITELTNDGVTQDDPSFTLIGSVLFNDGGAGRILSFFPDTKKQSRYIKLYFPDSRSSNYMSLSEIYLYNVE